MKQKRWVVLCMAASLDGKIAAAHGAPKRLGSAADLARLMALRRWADVLVVGAGTLRAIDPPMCVAGGSPQVVVVSRRGHLAGSVRGLHFDPARPAPILATAHSLAPRTPLADRVTAHTLQHWLLPGGDGQIDVAALLDRLASIGLRRVLVEGGGQLADGFVRAGAIDELVVTLSPVLLGGQLAPSLVGGTGLSHAQARKFRLHTVRKEGDELFLRYVRCPQRHGLYGLPTDAPAERAARGCSTDP